MAAMMLMIIMYNKAIVKIIIIIIIIAVILWQPPLISQLFHPGFLKAAPFYTAWLFLCGFHFFLLFKYIPKANHKLALRFFLHKTLFFSTVAMKMI